MRRFFWGEKEGGKDKGGQGRARVRGLEVELELEMEWGENS